MIGEINGLHCIHFHLSKKQRNKGLHKFSVPSHSRIRDGIGLRIFNPLFLQEVERDKTYLNHFTSQRKLLDCVCACTHRSKHLKKKLVSLCDK